MDYLTDEMLARFEGRAATYDRENRFFDEDFAELQASGYLGIAIPEHFGGPELRLAEVLDLQGRLASVAPATPLGVNMHLYWTGLPAHLHRAADRRAGGRTRHAGHPEPGQDPGGGVRP